MLTYLGIKCYDICNLTDNGSASKFTPSTCIGHTHTHAPTVRNVHSDASTLQPHWTTLKSWGYTKLLPTRGWSWLLTTQSAPGFWSTLPHLPQLLQHPSPAHMHTTHPHLLCLATFYHPSWVSPWERSSLTLFHLHCWDTAGQRGQGSCYCKIYLAWKKGLVYSLT